MVREFSPYPWVKIYDICFARLNSLLEHSSYGGLPANREFPLALTGEYFCWARAVGLEAGLGLLFLPLSQPVNHSFSAPGQVGLNGFGGCFRVVGVEGIEDGFVPKIGRGSRRESGCLFGKLAVGA